jgi:hypothetical protein
MPEYYVEVAIWIDADDEDAAEREIEQILASPPQRYDILNVETSVGD